VRQLEARSSQVSFKDLYTAVLALQSAHEDRCPACDTPLNSVTIDPYQKATAGLRDLLDLAVLQDEVADCREKTDDASRSLRANLDTLFSSMTLDEKNRTSVGRYIAALDQTPRSDRWWQDVYAPIRIDGAEAEPASLEQVLTVASRLELRDQEIQRQIQERQTIVQEREQLLQWQRQILERELIRKSIVDEIAAARERIARFDEENANLIQRAEQESQNINRDRRSKRRTIDFYPCCDVFETSCPGCSWRASTIWQRTYTTNSTITIPTRTSWLRCTSPSQANSV
jgi:hypothetical protein